MDIVGSAAADHDPSSVGTLIFPIWHHSTNDIPCLQPVHTFMMIPVFDCNDPALVDMAQQPTPAPHRFDGKHGLHCIAVALSRHITAAQGVQVMVLRDPKYMPVVCGPPASPGCNFPIHGKTG